MLKISKLSVNHGDNQALVDVSADIAAGQVTAMIGSNGAGKTTLLKTISGLHRAHAGSVHVFNDDVTNLGASGIVAKGVSQVPEGRELFPRMSVLDNLLVGAHLYRGPEVRQNVEKVFSYFPILAEKRAFNANSLSGGQQQMLAFGRALMSRPRFLLLDEPSTGLSPLVERDLMEKVSDLAKIEDIGILLVEQNATLALSSAEYAYVLENGSVALEGKAASLLADERIMAAYLGI